jgi:hypothetical protein
MPFLACAIARESQYDRPACGECSEVEHPNPAPSPRFAWPVSLAMTPLPILMAHQYLLDLVSIAA